MVFALPLPFFGKRRVALKGLCEIKISKLNVGYVFESWPTLIVESQLVLCASRVEIGRMLARFGPLAADARDGIVLLPRLERFNNDRRNGRDGSLLIRLHKRRMTRLGDVAFAVASY